MQIAIVVGSHRKESQSSRVGAYIASDLARIDPSVTVDTIDLAGNPLPLWDESVWQGDSALSALWKPYRDRMRRADGFVIIAPEWAGMVPPGLKNLLLFAGPKEVGHKPAMIVAVSASRGGAIRSTSSVPAATRTAGWSTSRSTSSFTTSTTCSRARRRRVIATPGSAAGSSLPIGSCLNMPKPSPRFAQAA